MPITQLCNDITKPQARRKVLGLLWCTTVGILILACVSNASAAPLAPPKPLLAQPSRAQKPVSVPQDINSDVPPASTYDQIGDKDVPLGTLAPESRGLLLQLSRVLVALLAVVCLIYFLAKLVLPRMLQQFGPRQSERLRIMERIMLDAKNALVMVENPEGACLILGVGEHGVQLIDRLPKSTFENLASANFAEVQNAVETGSSAEKRA